MALRTSEEKYRSLFVKMGQGYGEIKMLRDAEGRARDLRYIELNPAFERLTGIQLAQTQGRTGRELFPELEDWWIETYDRVVRTREPEHIEYEVASLGRWYDVLVVMQM